jgi:hypothetical protein
MSGTNFFFTTEPCPYCHRSSEKIHIGKSAYGWSFSFQGHPDLEIMSYCAWLYKFKYTPGWIIVDENDEAISYEDFTSMVEHKKFGKNHARIFKGIPPYTKDEETYIEGHEIRQLWPEEYGASHYWLDDDGNSFTSHEFS